MPPKIDVRIAYEPGAKIGQDYNRIMRESAHEWVLFLDHDVLLLHPSWYEVCQRVVADHPDGGLFTCWTNNIGCKHQLDPGAPKGHDIAQHRKRARALWDQHGYGVTENRQWLIGGFFMLTSKAAWQRAGGFPEDGFFGVDNEYHRRVLRNGLTCYRMDGLYAYHIRDRSGGAWIEGVPTSADLVKCRTAVDFERSLGPVFAAAVPRRRCIYTVITGDYDPAPEGYCFPGWDYIVLTDRPNLQVSGLWRRTVFDGEGLSPARASRLPKILPHRYLSDYDYSIYHDASLTWRRRNPVALASALDWPDYSTVAHPDRNCVYQEMVAIAKCNKASAAAAEAEARRYRAMGVPEGVSLASCGLLLRRHNEPRVKAFGEAWWRAYMESETVRDQPSFAVQRRLHDFPVTMISALRRDEYLRWTPHIRKAPPC